MALFSCKKELENYSISVSANRIEGVDAKEFKSTINIETTGQWRVREEIAWCTISPMEGTGSGVITVELDENASLDSRDARFRIYSSTDAEIVEVIQSSAREEDLIEKLCLSLTKGKSYLAVANNVVFDVAANESFSISMKMCCSTNSGSGDAKGSRVMTRRSGSKSGFELFFNSTGNLAMTFEDDAGAGMPTGYTNTVLTDGEWHNIAFVFNRDEGYSCLYVDGVQEGKKDHKAISTNSISSDQPLLLGVKNLELASPLIGLLDNVSFFKTALTSEDLTVDLSEAAREKLIAKWNFNIMPGAAIKDSINGFVGELKQDAELIPEGEEPAAIVKSKFVFRSGTENTVLFRCPTLVTATNGDLIMVSDQRVSDPADVGLNTNINLVLKRSADNGETWSETQVIADLPEGESLSDPSLIVDQETGKIFLFTVYYNHAGSEGKYLTYVYESDDNGYTWSDFKDITAELRLDKLFPDKLRFATNGGGLYLKNGKIRHTMVLAKRPSKFYMIGSNDHGETWFLHEQALSGNECKIVELADGNIMFNARSGREDFKGRQIHITTDEGKVIKSWDDASLIDPICNADIMSYSSSALGDVLLFSNCAHETVRDDLTIKRSFDEGETWGSPIVIDKNAGYSVMTTMKDGSVGLAYENGTHGVKFVRLTFDK